MLPLHHEPVEHYIGLQPINNDVEDRGFEPLAYSA